MNAHATDRRMPRNRALLLALLATSATLLPASLLAAEPSPGQSPAASVASPGSAEGSATAPAASLSPADAACQSAANLGLIVQFLRETNTSEDGWLPILVGAIAGLSEARELVGLVDASYRPLVDDLVIALQGLFAIADEVRELDTLGSKVAALGEAITAVGVAMDDLSVALQDPCPAAA
jgi:hypothetical protein